MQHTTVAIIGTSRLHGTSCDGVPQDLPVRIINIPRVLSRRTPSRVAESIAYCSCRLRTSVRLGSSHNTMECHAAPRSTRALIGQLCAGTPSNEPAIPACHVADKPHHADSRVATRLPPQPHGVSMDAQGCVGTFAGELGVNRMQSRIVKYDVQRLQGGPCRR